MISRVPRALVINDGVEAAFGQLERCRCHRWMAQQALWRQHEQRQRVCDEQQRLPPSDMKHARRSAVDKSQVEVRGGLQNPFGPGAGMLGALALVSVRQEKHKGCSQSHFARAEVTN